MSRHLNALGVETEDGRWIRSVPVYRTVTLESLSDVGLKGRARSRAARLSLQFMHGAKSQAPTGQRPG